MPIHHDFSREADGGPAGAGMRRIEIGSGAIAHAAGGLRLSVRSTPGTRYANAQLDDYKGLPRRAFLDAPPLALTVRARFSHEAASTPAGPGLLGTAGFGFWNDPFMMTDPRPPSLPRALWFFYGSPPNNMKLDLATPGHGWKAATIDALRPSAAPWALLSPVLVPLMNVRPAYRVLWPHIQSALRIREALVPGRLTTWRTYRIEWGTRRVRFLVDGHPVLETDAPPRGPLGFVAWCDNQYAIATPWGRFGHGVLSVAGEQWLELASLTLE